MKKIILIINIFIGLKSFAAAYIPVVAYCNRNYETGPTLFQCKQLNDKIISTAFSRESIASVCQLGEKSANAAEIYVAVAMQRHNNPQYHRNVSVEKTCQLLGGTLDTH